MIIFFFIIVLNTILALIIAQSNFYVTILNFTSVWYKNFQFKSENWLTLRYNRNQNIRKGQTYALIHWAAKFKPKLSHRRNKFKTFDFVWGLKALMLRLRVSGIFQVQHMKGS